MQARIYYVQIDFNCVFPETIIRLLSHRVVNKGTSKKSSAYMLEAIQPLLQPLREGFIGLKNWIKSLRPKQNEKRQTAFNKFRLRLPPFANNSERSCIFWNHFLRANVEVLSHLPEGEGSTAG